MGACNPERWIGYRSKHRRGEVISRVDVVGLETRSLGSQQDFYMFLSFLAENPSPSDAGSESDRTAPLRPIRVQSGELGEDCGQAKPTDDSGGGIFRILRG